MYYTGRLLLLFEQLEVGTLEMLYLYSRSLDRFSLTTFNSCFLCHSNARVALDQDSSMFDLLICSLG